MKTTIITRYAVALLTLLGVTSCDKYLDIVPKGKQLLQTVEDYSDLMNDYNCYTYPATDIFSLTDDMWISPVLLSQFNSQTYIKANLGFCGTEDVVKYDRQRFYLIGSSYSGFYLSCYHRINKVSNIILSSIDLATGSESLKATTIAEAKVLRAYNYFMLINMFSKHYDQATAETDGGVPLVTEFDMSKEPVQVSVAAIYRQIEDDVNSAIVSNALVDDPAGPLHPSRAMAYALKAKMHLFKKEWAQAKEAALASYNINHYVEDLVAYMATQNYPIVYANNKENLYFALSSDTYTMTGGGVGSGFMPISPELRDLFDPRVPANTDPTKLPKDFTPATANDQRLALRFSYNTGGAGNETMDKNYVPSYDRDIAAGHNYYFNGAGMRTTEVILMLAELEARAGNFTQMNKYLDEVRTKRIKSYKPETSIPATWVEGVNTVMNERRKEFIMGYFNRFFDLRRLNTEPEFKKTITRKAPANPNNKDIPQATYTLTPESRWWICLFPKEELERNKNIKNNVANEQFK